MYILLPIWYDQLSEFGIVAFLLVPSFFIGVPFPLLLKTAASFKDKKTVPFLLGISSAAGVSASIFAIVISIIFGYKFVFLFGLVGYSLVVVAAYGLKQPKNTQL